MTALQFKQALLEKRYLTLQPKYLSEITTHQ